MRLADKMHAAVNNQSRIASPKQNWWIFSSRLTHATWWTIMSKLSWLDLVTSSTDDQHTHKDRQPSCLEPVTYALPLHWKNPNRKIFTWPRVTIVVAPPGVLWITPNHNLPVMTLQGRVNNLERHVSDKLLPILLKQVHYSCSWIRCCKGQENSYTVVNGKPLEIHESRAYISDKVTTFHW